MLYCVQIYGIAGGYGMNTNFKTALFGGFDREDVFRCLKTGLGGITPDECDILEN